MHASKQLVNPWPFWLLLVGVALFGGRADARPGGPAGFCDAYPDSAHCSGMLPKCTLCHTGTGELDLGWNAYGLDVIGALSNLGHDYTEASFNALIDDAVLDVEAGDVDDDGVLTLEEILLGTGPGDALDVFVANPAPQGTPNPHYDVAAWDAVFAYKRVAQTFCGRSATYDELQALDDAADVQQEVHDKLDACLQGAHWRQTVLPRLADAKVRPINFGTSWNWDYRLWRYINTDGRDARELLSADYHVRELSPGVLTATTTLPAGGSCTTADGCADVDQRCDCSLVMGTTNCQSPGTCVYIDGVQPCQVDRRAGMLTTQWFHFINTMFSPLPRTTAAQAMRAYAGMDYAHQEGLTYVEGEPLDVDNKAVGAYTCKQCHMALDTAAYAFAEYHGIDGPTSQWDDTRPAAKQLWTSGNRPQAYYLEEPVDDLQDFADAMAASEAFERNHAELFFEYAVGRKLAPDEMDDLATAQQALRDSTFSTDALLHAIVDTDAFGRP